MYRNGTPLSSYLSTNMMKRNDIKLWREHVVMLPVWVLLTAFMQSQRYLFNQVTIYRDKNGDKRLPRTAKMSLCYRRLNSAGMNVVKIRIRYVNNLSIISVSIIYFDISLTVELNYLLSSLTYYCLLKYFDMDVVKSWFRRNTHQYPSCLQATSASTLSNYLSQTVPHSPL